MFSRYGIKIAKFRTRAECASYPMLEMGHSALAVGTKPPEIEKLIGTLHCHFPSATLCILLHLLWEMDRNL